jgi:phage/plasmid-like protein (TIGR03299 family)
MAHNLKQNVNGQMAMLYTGATPWHGLGTACPDSFHAHEAMKAFPFTYHKESIHRPDGTKIPGRCSIVVNDTNLVVGQASEDYGLVQPAECFDFMDSISSQGKLLYKTVGALGIGEKIWLLAHTPDNIWEPIKGDPIEDYLLFTTSYDCSTPNEVRGTSVTVVCQNTLHQATRGSKVVISIAHKKNVKERLAMAAEIMQSYEQQNQSFREAMIYLAKHPINDQLIKDFEAEMFGDLEKTEEGRGKTILLKKIQKYEELLFTGKGTDIKGRVGSAYGMVQAYTEWADWFRSKDGSDTNSILYGGAAKEKTRALDYALILVGGKS